MATIDSRSIIREMLDNDGIYPGDPQAFEIYSYLTNWNKRTYSVCYDLRASVSLHAAVGDWVHVPLLLWSQAEGLTLFGKRFLNGEY